MFLLQQLPAAGAFLFTILCTLAALRWAGRKEVTDRRLRELSGREGTVAPPRPVARDASLRGVSKLLEPNTAQERGRLQARLIRAGFYRADAMASFLTIKLLLMFLPIVAGVTVGLLNIVPVWTGLRCGVIGSLFGLVGPGLWLSYAISRRQLLLRRALPDTLDVLVICLDGGLSLQAGINRVIVELGNAFPELAAEIRIVLREAQVGLSIGEALRHFGERADLEEVRNLAAVIIQSERYGASLGKALRTHAESMRVQRLHRAEELGQKASVKIIFPTILFILPAFFIVVMGPALIRIAGIFTVRKRKKGR